VAQKNSALADSCFIARKQLSALHSRRLFSSLSSLCTAVVMLALTIAASVNAVTRAWKYISKAESEILIKDLIDLLLK